MAGFSITAKLGLDSSKFTSKMNGLKGSVKEFGAALGTLVKAGAVAAGAAITALAVKGIRDFVEFDKGMREVFTLLPEATEQMKEQMMGDIRELAKVMGVDLIDATNALYQAISAGIPEENAVSFLGEATKLAVGGVSDLETAVSALATVMNGYGMAASDAGRISDVLFTAVKGGMTTIDELAANIGKVTPVAAELGVAFEEVGAMFATLTSTLGAGKTAEAGTQIKAMLLELGKAGTIASKAFQELSGVGFRDFIKGGGTVNEALQLMADHAQANGISLSDMFSSIEAGQGAMILAADAGAKLTAELEAQAAGAGSATAAYLEMEKSVSRQMDKLASQMHEVGLQMGEALLPVATTIMPMIAAAFEMLLPVLGGTAGASESAAAGMEAIVTAAEFVLKGILMLVNTFQMFGAILAYVGKQVATFVNVLMDFGKAALAPIVDAVAAVGEAFAALGEILANPTDAEEGIKKLKKANEDMGKAMEGFGDAFMDAWDKNLAGFQENNDQLVQDMLHSGKAFIAVWKANLAAADAAGAANEKAVAPLVKGAAAAQGINAGMKGARRAAGPLADRLKMVKAQLEGAKKWAEKCKVAQEQWNAAAEKGKDFHQGMVGLLKDLLASDKLRTAERTAYGKMLKQQLDLEQQMTDVTEKGYNWLHLQVVSWESIADEAKRHIKDLPEMQARYEAIKERIRIANLNMKDAGFMAKIFARQGLLAKNNWADAAPMAEALAAAISEVARLTDEIEMLEMMGEAPAKIEEVKKKLGEALEKQKEINAEAGKHPMFEGGELNPKAGDFQIFRDMDQKLGQIDEKLGGFFVNQ